MDDIFVCDSCGRDTRSKTRLCRRCRGVGDLNDERPSPYGRRKRRRAKDDDAGREADEGWAYDDCEFDS